MSLEAVTLLRSSLLSDAFERVPFNGHVPVLPGPLGISTAGPLVRDRRRLEVVRKSLQPADVYRELYTRAQQCVQPVYDFAA
jgi:hypothetical protein